MLAKGISTKSITVNANAVDEGSGIKEYKFYIGTTIGEYGEPITQNPEEKGIYTFDNLSQNTTYYIKVEVTDNAGNTAQQEISAKTYLVPKDIDSSMEWNESSNPKEATANVTLSTNRNYNIMYTDEMTNGEPTNWKSYEEETKINKVNGSTIYACLTDGLNYGEYVPIIITDFDGPIVNIETNGVTTNAVTVSVNAEDKDEIKQ